MLRGHPPPPPPPMMLRTADIDKELTATRLWFAGICHGQCPRQVANALLWFSNFIRNAAIDIASIRLSITRLKGLVGRRTASAGASRVGILGMGAAKLDQERNDDSEENKKTCRSRLNRHYEEWTSMMTNSKRCKQVKTQVHHKGDHFARQKMTYLVHEACNNKWKNKNISRRT
jgi:hypothetical protein